MLESFSPYHCAVIYMLITTKLKYFVMYIINSVIILNYYYYSNYTVFNKFSL